MLEDVTTLHCREFFYERLFFTALGKLSLALIKRDWFGVSERLNYSLADSPESAVVFIVKTCRGAQQDVFVAATLALR